MKNNRPKMAIPFETMDIIVEAISIVSLILIWGVFIKEYNQLPETVATHFNALGEADGFGNKSVLWLVPAIATVLYIGLFILNKYPYLHNYMVNITEENAFRNYRMSTRILRFVSLFTILMLGFVSYMVIAHSKGYPVNAGWVLPCLIGISIVFPIILIVYQFKKNKL